MSLRRRPLCQTLSKALEMSRAIVLLSKEESSELMIRSVITVSISAVEREERNPYCTSDKSEDFSRWVIIWLLIRDSKTLLIMGRRLIGRYLEESHHSPEFLKTGQTDELFFFFFFFFFIIANYPEQGHESHLSAKG